MNMKVTKEQFIGMTYDELLAENEKLWALNEHMGLKDMAVIGGLEKENERLKAYNAELRELAAEAWRYINHPADATWTHEKRKEVRDSLNDRMRELGVDE